jgi:hypothetical protein
LPDVQFAQFAAGVSPKHKNLPFEDEMPNC